MAASNRYNMPGVANTFMTLFKKKNEAHLKITPRGKSGKPHSIPCKSIKDNADVTMLWNKFKEQYKGELDTEIDKILLYSKKAERQKALNVLWKFKRDGHLKGQTTEQKTWNKKMYKAKWEQLIALVEAYRLPSHPKNKKNETKNKTNMKRKKKSKKPDDQLPSSGFEKSEATQKNILTWTKQHKKPSRGQNNSNAKKPASQSKSSRGQSKKVSNTASRSKHELGDDPKVKAAFVMKFMNEEAVCDLVLEEKAMQSTIDRKRRESTTVAVESVEWQYSEAWLCAALLGGCKSRYDKIRIRRTTTKDYVLNEHEDEPAVLSKAKKHHKYDANEIKM
eukprot:1010500_1